MSALCHRTAAAFSRTRLVGASLLMATCAAFIPAASLRADVVSEAEALPRTSTGATTSLSNDASASGGVWVACNADGVGDFVDYVFGNIPAGTYSVRLKYKAHPNRGIISLKVDGTQIGGNLDQYSATTAYPEHTFGSVTFTSAGSHVVRLTVVGRNAAAGAYTISADRISFVGGGTTPGDDAKFVIPGSAVTATANDGNVPANVVDGNLATRWSASGDPQHIQFNLGGAKKVAFVKIAFYNGAARASRFDVLTSSDGTNFTSARSGVTSSGTTTALETFDFPDVSGATHVRIVGHGNTVNAWNSYTEVEIWGTASTTPGQTAAPTFSPGSGNYTSAQSVTIASATSGASIRYTTDGSAPTSTSGTIYTGPVAVSTDTTLRAIAYASGLTDSAVTSATYTFSTQQQVANPTFSPPGGTFTGPFSVTISTSTAGSSIRYTTNGTAPTPTTGTLYTGPVTVSASTTFQAIAYQTGFTASDVVTASYTISGGTGPFRPFPQQINFPGTIKPTNVTQAQMNDAIRSYYAYWKSAYVRQSNGGTPGGGYYVNMKGTGGSGTEITTSEAHGYGMLTFALMAGHDSTAKQYFDGMFNMYHRHRSTGDSDLMSWVIDQTESTSKDSASATDGDMDIAYALILADRQWGSGGAIDYIGHARRMITNGLKASCMHPTLKRTRLGDWANSGNYADATRASDWMTGHMRAYQAVTGDAFWNDAVSAAYTMVTQITNGHASTTGLMPDFIIGNPARPAPANFLEAATDDDYSWNSCRYPWRMALDVAHNNSSQARAALNKTLGWLKGKTGGTPNNIMAGYTLSGNALVTYGSAAFTSPFVAGCIADPAHQAYLNAGWTRINNWRDSYYGDSINLLCMLVISGNWWAP